MTRRLAIVLALARYQDQPLTREVARSLIADLFPNRTIDPAQFGQAVYGRITFQAELLRDIREEIHPMHLAHWAENEQRRNGEELAMDYDAMEEDEYAGRLVQFTARFEGQLVGNFRLYLLTSRHTGKAFAKEDTLYLSPEHRGGRAALRFLEFAKASLMGLGYRKFAADARIFTQVGRLLEHCGFEPLATQYELNMEDDANVH